jgi:glycosyltransferase involved in cell wall biosynthesis
MVPHKRIDLVVEAFAQMPNRKLVVIGAGSDYERIAAKATHNVTMMGSQPFEVLRDHMQRARAFVFASEEEFGIIAVEAQACGTPVIAYGRGGALETVVNGQTGLLFERQSPECIRETVERFDWAGTHIHPEAVRAHAEKFGAERFRREMEYVVDRLWTEFRQFHRGDRSANFVPFPLDQIVQEISQTCFQESPTCSYIEK